MPIWWDSKGISLEKSKFFVVIFDIRYFCDHNSLMLSRLLDSICHCKITEVVCYKESVKMHSLPLTKKRKKSDGKVVAKAAQTIYVEPQSDNMPGYICGRMEIPPLGIKDEEGVGPCSQVFNVGECQPKSVELAIADPDVNGGNFDAKTARRFMLSDGDEFHVPAGNVYRLQNHSTSCSCVLNWVIIRPLPREED